MSEIETARQLHRRAIPIGLVQDAMFLGACRKFDSWLNGGSSEPIQSMSYFEQLIAEIQAKPLPAGYSTHLHSQIQRLAERWSKSVLTREAPKQGVAYDDAGLAPPPYFRESEN